MNLKDLPHATEQQVFDTVAKHLLTQMQQSRITVDGTSSSCLYRGPNGLKCAAGVLIGDDEYHEDMENHSWNALAKDGLVPSEHKCLISILQNLHDFSLPNNWHYELTQLAQRFALKTDVLFTR